MISSALAAMLSRRNIHYGWVMVAATFLTMLVAAAAVGAPGVLIVPLQKEFGWSAAEVSFALAIRLILFGALGPFAAAFINRFGLRAIVGTAMLLISAGYLGSMFMTQLWQLLLLWGIVIGVGTGLVAMVLAATVAARWFVHRRGLVMGLLAASSATGQLLFLPLMAELTERHGWRATVMFVCAVLLVAAVVAILLMRDRPADLGLPVYGEAAVAPPASDGMSLRDHMLSPIRVLKEAAGVPAFWILAGSFFICGASTNGLIQTHFVALCGDYGIAPVAAAGVLAMMGLFDFIGTVGSGWLSDRYDNRWLLFWYYGLRGISLALLPFSDFTFYGLSLFAVFYGLDWIATVPPTVKLIAHRFGAEKAGLVFGWVFASHQIGAATAAYGAGLSRTVLSSYLPAFFIAGMLCIVAAVMVLGIDRGRHATPQVA
ncbi:MFS transporter [Allopusillimonas soli]|uniref:MFS transporter n=1 Tax=Allopusillimonas soli TaxID=659016 RepID=A0A853F6I5_9BURK|nr:MFS transporter [Allopusillimonas soli]NYT35703.1 MFS transporter [Allopusillimonas soli]TEA76094.1 MFS transporter [Allopusillimonas soli]